MIRLTRKNLKVFASGASNNGVFGSLQANNPTKTNNIETLQSLPAWEAGWNSATESSEMLPPLEESQALDYVETYQLAYLLQEGVAEWNANTTYYQGSFAKEIKTGGFNLYNSLIDDNIGNPVSDTASWKKIMDSDDVYAFQSDVNEIKQWVHIVETYSSGTDGYIVYSDGYCEQWGLFDKGYASSGSEAVTLLKEYVDTNYGVGATMVATSAYAVYAPMVVLPLSKTQFTCALINANWQYMYWVARGYVDLGENS